jgi:hypothetical protein
MLNKVEVRSKPSLDRFHYCSLEFKAQLRKAHLALAIALKAVKFSLYLETFFASMTWKSSGEPGSTMI